ncbi:TPA: hypothetical protein SMR47_002339 [Pseudomonas putida]|nr:hypothetical protein [Pseudomonas putida]
MALAVLSLSLYFVIPALFGYVGHVISSPSKKAWCAKTAKNVLLWRHLDYATAIFVTTSVAFFLTGFLLFFGFKPSDKILLSVLAVNCLASIGFLYYHWNVAKYWAKYGGLLKTLSIPVALGFTTLSKIYSDAEIAELSGISPQDLPTAQLFITFILTPVVWLIAISLGAGYLCMPVMPYLALKHLIQEYRHRHKKIAGTDANNFARPVAIFAVAFAPLILLTIMQKILTKGIYEPRLKQAIVFSSFHLPTTYCGLPDVKGVSVAAMPDSRGALAIPDSKVTYRFVPIACKPPNTSTDKTLGLLSLSDE